MLIEMNGGEMIYLSQYKSPFFPQDHERHMIIDRHNAITFNLIIVQFNVI
jgi:hypothetical protein